MIKLDKKTKQDFLDREWVTKLIESGIDMSDAKYYIGRGIVSGIDYIVYKDDLDNYTFAGNPIPTYTTSELLYKLHEWIYLLIDGIEYSGGLELYKDAPFYRFYYSLKEIEGMGRFTEELYASYEYPIESLASLLIQCQKRGLGCVENISNK
jgi:hypothetical protein